ncbi:hypothetical protein [Photobacterium damselae]|uniref:hypothetical protein n=1 Tax=Photobacterium damselae TaxID=38293 RepID=UPI001F19C6AA|nr:hypothetical protein [Photobacterium damselae]UKA04800.1 hypothetical protein IHC89_21395 [Photobacterium damselae subsp. damselae]
MTIFRSTFELQIDVDFKDKIKAEQFFIEGTWKDHFYVFNDLDDAAEHLSLNFHKYSDSWEDGGSWKYIEGFGSFLYNKDTKSWHLTSKDGEVGDFECGDIEIKYEMELDCTDTRELEN